MQCAVAIIRVPAFEELPADFVVDLVENTLQRGESTSKGTRMKLKFDFGDL